MKCANLARLLQVLPTASHRRPRRRRPAFECYFEQLDQRLLLASSSVLFQDTFSSSTPSSAWSFVGGTWQINKGTLSQTSTAAADPKKAMITNQTYPSNLMITAEVQVNSWNAGDMARAGVGLYTNPSNGNGYNLVFHGTNQVQFLDDKVTWGNAYTFHWQVGTWYWFQLAEINGTLEGKVWAAGTAEPQSWMFQQTGWTNLTKGAPALNGGSASTSAGSSTVSFASVSVTTTSVQPDTATPTPPPTTTLPAPIAGTNYQLVFQDNFPGTSVNPANQNAVSPFGHPVESSNPNFSYSASNVSVANGVATITAQNTGGGYTGTWTGGILNAETQLYQYGYFSVTAKLPAGAGFCPAIWLCHTDAEADATGTLGELDMLEATGGNTAYQTAHTDSGQVYQAKTTNASLTTGYNTYGLLWTPTSVTYYINGVKTGSYNVAIPDQMYMIISLDVCGSNDWVGPPNASTPTTAALDISSVQIYQLS